MTVSLDREQIILHRRSTTLLRVWKIPFLKPRLRISFRICSIEFISGVYGGSGKISILVGISRPLDLCQTAPSATIRMKSYVLSVLFPYQFQKKTAVHTSNAIFIPVLFASNICWVIYRINSNKRLDLCFFAGFVFNNIQEFFRYISYRNQYKIIRSFLVNWYFCK